MHKKCTFFFISAHVLKAANTNVLLVLYNREYSVNESVFEWIEWVSDSTVHSEGLTSFVSIESAIGNESFNLIIQVIY